MEVLGIQFITPVGLDALNTAMFTGRRSPWVRETSAIQPYLTWKLPLQSRPDIQWRDAVILDENGEFFGVQNLTGESLSVAANRTALSTDLSGAASISDTDLDGLPDDWELLHRGTVSDGPSTDPGNGRPLLLSYAQGLTPTARSDGPVISEVVSGGLTYYQVEFRQLQGLEGVTGTLPARLLWLPEVLVPHSGTAWRNSGWTLISNTDPWDGTGTTIVKMRSPVPIRGAGAPPSQFVRLKVEVAP